MEHSRKLIIHFKARYSIVVGSTVKLTWRYWLSVMLSSFQQGLSRGGLGSWIRKPQRFLFFFFCFPNQRSPNFRIFYVQTLILEFQNSKPQFLFWIKIIEIREEQGTRILKLEGFATWIRYTRNNWWWSARCPAARLFGQRTRADRYSVCQSAAPREDVCCASAAHQLPVCCALPHMDDLSVQNVFLWLQNNI